MKNNLFLIAVLALSIKSFSQVGIGTVTPGSTLDVVASNPTGTTTTVDGILIPRVTRERAQSMTSITTSTMIYVNDVVTGSATGNAINITSVGFYYYDGTVWIKLNGVSSGNPWNITGNANATSGTNFIGTTNNQALDFRTNNVIKSRLTTKGQLAFLNTGNSVFIGDQAGNVDDLSTNENSFIGYQSGLATTTGSGNVALGAYSLKSSVATTNNTATGYQTMENATTANDISAYGYRALRANTGARNNAFGSGALDVNTTGTDNVAMGYNALGTNIGASKNIAIGTEALSTYNTNDNFAQNVAIGHYSMRFANGGNSKWNVAVGYHTLRDNQGESNTAVGNVSLVFNTTGNENSSFGGNTLGANTTGIRNTALGYLSLRNNVDGNNNTAVGYNALGSITTGSSFNTAIGINAGVNISTTTSRSVYIGANAGPPTAGSEIGSSSNRLYIDNNSSLTPLIGGDFTNRRVTINGNIGIDATHSLNVVGTAKITEFMNLVPQNIAPASPNTGDIYYDNNDNKVKVWTGGTWENLN